MYEFESIHKRKQNGVNTLTHFQKKESLGISAKGFGLKSNFSKIKADDPKSSSIFPHEK